MGLAWGLPSQGHQEHSWDVASLPQRPSAHPPTRPVLRCAGQGPGHKAVASLRLTRHVISTPELYFHHTIHLKT
jgi:hypothetical protein